MGFKISIVVAIAIAIGLAAAAPDQTREDEHHKAGQEVDWYDCTGKAIGNYQHPHECTMYIACASGNRAFEMPCASCDYDPVRCPDLRTHYVEARDQCLWADEAGCSAGPTTHVPPTDPTTHRTTTPEATDPPGPVKPIQPIEGEECIPDECTVVGWCHWYAWCKRDDDDGLGADHKGEGKIGHWKLGSCTEAHNLFFNHVLNDYGGECSHWDGIVEPYITAYNNDTECINAHCDWNVDPDAKFCASTYLYFNPQLYGGKEVKLSCSSHNDVQLLWSQDKKGCVHCSEVFREDGLPCCD